MNEVKLANPGPLGLMGFGMTTILLNIHNAGFFPVSAVILAMGLFYGGLAQVIAGILEYRKGNTFGVTAFTSYGFFWIALVFTWVLPKLGWTEATPEAFMGWFLALWGVFTFFMFIGTLKANRGLQFVFLSLTALFALLALRDFTGSHAIGVLAGYVGLVCGASAIYLAMAEVLAEMYGRKVMPY
ncbi:MAG: acetate uptake transporter [Planctomycetes bacterium]|nr:acetate uptake transporter [Planctomycetota bacterium]